jgi:hypothetical protein
MKKTIALAIALASQLPRSPRARIRHPTQTAPTASRGQACLTGYVGVGKFREALHNDAPMAYPKIKGVPCPSGTFASGDYCKRFH